MLTMVKTVSTQLDTPEAIAAYLKSAAQESLDKSGFSAGDEVTISDRTSIPDGMAVGNIGVVLSGSTTADQVLVLVATEQGIGVALQLRAAILTKLS